MAEAIEDIYKYIAADSTLQTLLSGSGSDKKIYPTPAPQNTTEPYITYEIYGDGPGEEYIKTIQVLFKIINSTSSAMNDIINRLKILMDRQDLVDISSSNYVFRRGKMILGNDLVDPDSKDIYKIQVYEFEFHNIQYPV